MLRRGPRGHTSLLRCPHDPARGARAQSQRMHTSPSLARPNAMQYSKPQSAHNLDLICLCCTSPQHDHDGRQTTRRVTGHTERSHCTRARPSCRVLGVRGVRWTRCRGIPQARDAPAPREAVQQRAPTRAAQARAQAHAPPPPTHTHTHARRPPRRAGLTRVGHSHSTTGGSSPFGLCWAAPWPHSIA